MQTGPLGMSDSTLYEKVDEGNNYANSSILKLFLQEVNYSELDDEEL